MGEMESGKSWFSSACAVAEVQAERHVLYFHFEESDPDGTVEKMLLLGATIEQIKLYFHFVAPDEPVSPQYLRPLLALEPSLVVMDGVNEAMSLHGLGIREEDGAAGYRRRLVKPFTRAGAAVLSCDHVVKNKEARGRSQIGSVHKGNGLDGSSIQLENIEPFGRGQKGVTKVFIAKDRPGHLRAHGLPVEDTPGKTYMGTLELDDTGNAEMFVKGPTLKFVPARRGADDTIKVQPVPQGIPNREGVAELISLFKEKFEDDPSGGYTKAELRALLAAQTKNDREKRAVRKRVDRAFSSLRDTLNILPGDDNPGGREEGKYRWSGPGDAFEKAPVGKFSPLETDTEVPQEGTETGDR